MGRCPHLNAHLRGQMRAEILRVHRAVTATAVYVTHDQIEAMTMGDRIVVMNAGCIRQVGTPDKLYDAPHTSRPGCRANARYGLSSRSASPARPATCICSTRPAAKHCADAKLPRPRLRKQSAPGPTAAGYQGAQIWCGALASRAKAPI